MIGNGLDTNQETNSAASQLAVAYLILGSVPLVLRVKTQRLANEKVIMWPDCSGSRHFLSGCAES